MKRAGDTEFKLISLRLMKHSSTSGIRKLVLILAALLLTVCRRYGPAFIISTAVFTYLIEPLLWCSVIFTVLCFPKTRPVRKIRENNYLVWITGVCAMVYVMSIMICGLAYGFGKSPFDHSLFGVALNAFKMFSVLIASELVRDYIVNGNGRNAKFAECVFAALFIYILSFNPVQFRNIETNLQIIQFVSVDLLAKLCGSFFATYLVYIGGPTLSILYLGIHDGFFWFCPILPNLSWIAQAFIETLLPVFSLILIRHSYGKKTRFRPSQMKDSENPLGWIAVSTVSILMIWFSIGVFPVRPYAIVTGSMMPEIYPGDIVLVKRDINDLQTGEIIQYKSGDIYIFHRITEIIEDEQATSYITKGDNNPFEDPKPVNISDIKGRVIYTVPKIGYPALLFH